MYCFRAALKAAAKKRAELLQQQQSCYLDTLDSASPDQIYLLQVCYCSRPSSVVCLHHHVASCWRQGFRRQWHLAKLWLFLEKAVLLCIPFFFPDHWEDYIGYTVACAILGVTLTLAVIARPYADVFESTMDIVSRFVVAVLFLRD